MAAIDTVSAPAAELPRLLKTQEDATLDGASATDQKPEQPRDDEAAQLELVAVAEEHEIRVDVDDTMVKKTSTRHESPAAMTWKDITCRLLMFLACLYGFIVGLVLMGDAFKVLGGRSASSFFSAIDNPVAGLTVGILVTVLVQSSSTCTSIVVGLVGAGQLSVHSAIPVIMGANIGTSVTNTIVSMGQSGDRDDLERAFAAATVHDMFNLLSVAVILPLEVIVCAIQGEGGPIYWLTNAMTDSLIGDSIGSGAGDSPISIITKPITSLIIKKNKYVIKALSYGLPLALDGDAGFCVSKAMGKAWKKIDEDAFSALQECGIVDQASCMNMISGSHCYVAADSFYNDHVVTAEVVSGGFVEGLGSTAGGLLALVISLTLLIGSLFFLVKALHSLMMGRARHCIMKAINLNDVLAMIVGAVVTMIVQSSSVVTSALTPLAGVGALELRKMLPLTLGANIGTCATGILAALAIMQRDAIQISLCHLMFNVFGILIWFPAPAMRRVPLGAAALLGLYASFFRFVPALYIAIAFLLVPAVALAVSILFEASLVAGIIVTLLLLAALSGFAWWWVKKGCYLVLSQEARENRFCQKTASLAAEEQEWERTYSESAAKPHSDSPVAVLAIEETHC